MNYCDLNTDKDIGASAHLIKIGPFLGLIDCGMHPKKTGLEALPNLSKIGHDTLDFICITHAHLDHCAALPLLAKQQPHALILTNHIGSELMLRMLRNSRAVMQRQREELGIKEYPLYAYEDIDDVRSRIIPMQNMRERTLESKGEQITISFWGAGHIPGASSVMLEYNKRKILFSGDMSFHSTGILKGANPPDTKIDTLIVETTRGSYDRPINSTYESEIERFVKSVANTIKDGGNVLVPAFALGRMQEILVIIKEAMKSGQIPVTTPIYASGLGVDIGELMIELSKKSHHYAFAKQAMEGVKPLKMKIEPAVDFEEKGIYILGSGMLVEKTPSYAAAAALAEHKANAIFFVGYCDTETPGGKLQATKNGDSFDFTDLLYTAKIQCKVDKFDLSSHADRSEILDFILKTDARCVILTHGSERSREWFFDEIIDATPKTQIIIPELSEEIFV